MKSHTGLALVILIVGLANAFVFAKGFRRIADTVAIKSFSPSVSPEDRRDVIALSGDRIAIIEDRRVSVFQVDRAGKVSRLDDVTTQYRDLEPYMAADNTYFDSPKKRLQDKMKLSPTPAPTTQSLPTMR